MNGWLGSYPRLVCLTTNAREIHIRGYGKVEDFEAEIDKLGLSEEAALKLNDVFYKYKKKAVY